MLQTQVNRKKGKEEEKMILEKDSKASGTRPITVDDKMTTEAQRTATAMKTIGDKNAPQKPNAGSGGFSTQNTQASQQITGPKIAITKGSR